MTSPGSRSLVAAAAALAAGACVYGFSGGGGLPEHIETVYVPPVENQTVRFALTEQVTQGLLDAVRGRLGAQLASEQEADAVIRVSLTGFGRQALSFGGREDRGAEVFQRRVTVTARVEIEDRVRGTSLFSGTVQGQGEYAPNEESEDVGLDVAVEELIQKVIDGAQSQW